MPPSTTRNPPPTRRKKKRATDVLATLDSIVAPAKNSPLPHEDAPEVGSTYSEREVTYTRYEITAAWPSIVAGLADCGDLQFSAAVNGSVLEAGDLKANPFPLYLTYTGKTMQTIAWGYQQMVEHPDYVKRVKDILEDKLQTAVTLELRARAYTEEEIRSFEEAQKTPFQKDLQNEPGLKELIDLLEGELVYSRPLNRQTGAFATESEEEINDN